MKLGFLTILFALSFSGPATADHDKPRYDWGAEGYYCEETGGPLSEDDFIRRALGLAWSRYGDSWREDWPTVGSWLVELPNCCSAQIRDSVWEIEERHTRGLFGWLTVWLAGSPTITVNLQVPQPDRHQPERWRMITYLLDQCGREKDRMG